MRNMVRRIVEWQRGKQKSMLNIAGGIIREHGRGWILRQSDDTKSSENCNSLWVMVFLRRQTPALCHGSTVDYLVRQAEEGMRTTIGMGTTLKCGIPRLGIPVQLSLCINEFMGEDQDTTAAREEGDKTEPVEESRCWMG